MFIYKGFCVNNNKQAKDMKLINLLKFNAKLYSHNNHLYDAKYVGQVHNTFLLFSTNDNFIIVDQHAAHEQIMYEKFIKEYKKSKEKSLFIKNINSFKLKISYEKYSILKEYNDILKELGIIVLFNKNNAISIKSLFLCYGEYSANKIIRIFSKECQNLADRESIKNNFIKSFCELNACRYSLKSGTMITEEEAYKIRDGLNNVANNNHCPHGRPIMHVITMKELLGYFLRPNYSQGIKI